MINDLERDLVTDAEADDVQGFNPPVITAGAAVAAVTAGAATGLALGVAVAATGLGVGYYLGSSSSSSANSQGSNCTPKGR